MVFQLEKWVQKIKFRTAIGLFFRSQIWTSIIRTILTPSTVNTLGHSTLIFAVSICVILEKNKINHFFISDCLNRYHTIHTVIFTWVTSIYFSALKLCDRIDLSSTFVVPVLYLSLSSFTKITVSYKRSFLQPRECKFSMRNFSGIFLAVNHSLWSYSYNMCTFYASLKGNHQRVQLQFHEV